MTDDDLQHLGIPAASVASASIGGAEDGGSRVTAQRDIRAVILITDALHDSAQRATMYVADATRSTSRTITRRRAMPLTQKTMKG